MRRLMMTAAIFGLVAWGGSPAQAGFAPQAPRLDNQRVNSIPATAHRMERQQSATYQLAAHCDHGYGYGYGNGSYTHAYRHGYHSNYYRTGYSNYRRTSYRHVPRHPAYIPRPYPNPHHGNYHIRNHYYRQPYRGGGGFGLYIGF